MIREDYLAFGKPNFGQEEMEGVARVMRSGWVGMGPETIAFERELSQFLGSPHVVTVNSCTSALFLALLVLGVGRGDEVICPSMTWCATANVALYLGAKPVFCDVDPDTLCVTPELLQEKLTPKTRAVMVVHFGGLAAEVEPIRALLPDGVAIVEDAAHALGAKFANGRPVGSSGQLACLSFYANKNLSTGDGGAIAVTEEEVAGRLCSLRQNAMPSDAWKRFSHPTSTPNCELGELGYKMNYTDLQASIGRVQLRRQAEFSARRLNIARCYYEGLQTISPPLRFQKDILHPNHSRHLFIIRLAEGHRSRDDLLLALRARNIGASIHYAPLHRMPLYSVHGTPALPNTEIVSQQIMTLPISAAMEEDDADYVVTHIKELLG